MFRRSMSVSAMLLILCLSGVAWASPEKTLLTAEEALNLAYENNPTLKAAGSRIEQARQRIKQARADTLPKLYASLDSAWRGEDGQIPVYSASGSSLGYGINDFDESYQAAIGFQWLLFSSGAVQNTISARDLAYKGVEAQEVRTGQTVEDSVLIAYYDLQRARAKLTVAEEMLELAKEHLVEVESFYKYGVVAKNEVLRVQVDVSDSQLQVISARNTVNVAWRTLERAVGTSLESRYALPDPENKADLDPMPKWDHRSLYGYRPELRALSYSEKSARALAAAYASSTGPQIVAGGQIFGAGQDFWPDQQDDWRLSLGIRWDFYDGGLSRAQKKEALASAEELLSNIDDFKNQVAMEVSSAQLNLESAIQRMNVASDQVASAEEDYRMALMRYKANVGTNLDVLDARTALSDTRTQLVDAVYDAYSGQANLRYALGISDKFMLKELEVPVEDTSKEAAQ